MQSAAGRRALSTLASKLHPPVPLSPHESKLLLNLLTQSFRAHLDREHPVAAGASRSAAQTRSSLVAAAQAARPESSYSSAHEHIDAILSNPLFARQPHRRASETGAVDVLRNPLNWFLDQIALGSADMSKATVCLELVGQKRGLRQPETESGRMPATVMADWLRTSGLDTSKTFLDMLDPPSRNAPRRFVNTLVPMLMLDEHNTAPLWRWFTRSPKLRMEETGQSAECIQSFRVRLLKDMAMCAQKSSRDDAMLIFLRVFDMYQKGEHEVTQRLIQPLGSSLVGRIEEDPSVVGSTDIYEAFTATASGWLGRWSTAVEAMLWLHHPTRPNPYPALAFIQDPSGAASHVMQRKSRRQFLVRLCLGAAQKLLDQGASVEAQIAMSFTKTHFAEIVLSRTPSTNEKTVTHARVVAENRNLDLLDRLLPI